MLNDLRLFPQVAVWAGELTQIVFQTLLDYKITQTEVSSHLGFEEPDDPHLNVHVYYYPDEMLQVGEEGSYSGSPTADAFCLSLSLEFLNSMTRENRLEFFEDEALGMVNAVREVISNEKGYNYATTH